MRAQAACAIVLLSLPLGAQSRPESAPETRGGLDAIREAMARVRPGGADVATVATVVEGLLKSEHPIAAPWWLALAPGADVKLTTTEQETLTRLRKACEKAESFADERKTILRLVRHVETLAADKNHEAARQAAAGARGFLGLVPDTALMRILDAAEKRIPPRKSEEAEAPPERIPWPTGLEADVAAAFRRLTELAVAAYRDAGCQPGRHVLAKSLRNLAGVVGSREASAALDRVRTLTPQVEPKSELVLFVRTVGTARIFREGVAVDVDQGTATFDAEKRDPIAVPVLPGDLVTIAVDEPYSSDDYGGKSFVLALHARFESRDLGVKDLFCDLGSAPGDPGAKLYPVPIAKKKPNPPESLFGRSQEQDEALKAFNAYFELPKTTRRSVDVPCLGDMVTFAQEFDARKLGFHWIGTETERFAAVVRVPD